MQTINNRKLDAKYTVERGLDLDRQWTSGKYACETHWAK